MSSDVPAATRRAGPAGAWARAHANVGGAVFGTITAAAVIAASAAHQESLPSTLVVTVVTVIVFWLAYVYEQVVDSHVHGGRLSPAIRVALVDELPVLEAPVPSMLMLLAGVFGLVDDDTAVELALWVAVAQLAAWGVVSGRRRGWAWPATALTAAVNATFGVVIIVLKALVH